MWLTFIQTIISGTILSLYGLVFIFLPAWIFIRSFHLTKLEKVAVSLVLGFSFYSLVIYVVRFVNLPFWVGEILLFLGLYLLILQSRFKLRQKWLQLFYKKLINSINTLRVWQWIFIVITVVTTLVHSAVLFRSGIITPTGVKFVELSFHDSMQHLSFITRLYDSSHVRHPGFAGADLKNYHYLIDSTLASLTRFPFVSLFDTYYRVYPMFISFVFILSVFVFTRHISKNKYIAILSVIFTVFGANASFYLQFIRGDEFIWSANTFLINPIVDILQNPASIFVLAQMLIVLLLVKITEEQNFKVNLRFWLIIGLIAGTMISFKAWGGLLINGTLLVGAIWQLVRFKSPNLFIALSLSLGLTAFLLLPGFDGQTSASPVWSPGWSLRRLMNDADRWNNIPDLYVEETFIFQKDYPRLLKLYTKWVGIYLVGNYWVRVLGFMLILSLLLKGTRIKTFELMILVLTLTSFTLPLLFNQGRMAYDIEQFAPYALVLSSIMTCVGIYLLIKKFPNKKPANLITYSVFLVLIIISAPSNATSIWARTTGETRLVTTQEQSLFSYVKEKTPSDAIFMLYPSHRNIATLEFAALTGRDTYYSGRTLSVITGENFDDRKETNIEFFNKMNRAQQQELIDQYNINYMFLFADDLEQLKDRNLPGELVFENGAGAIWELK